MRRPAGAPPRTVKRLLILSLLGLLIVGGLTWYSNLLIEDVERVDAELEEEYGTLVASLRELDRRHPAPEPDENRYLKVLAIRHHVSKAWEQLGTNARREAMGGRVLRNALLDALLQGLTLEEMGPTEYRSLVRRLGEDPVLATEFATGIARGIHAPEVRPFLEEILGPPPG